MKILNKIFSCAFWLSLLAYLLPWIVGFHGLIYGSGMSSLDRFRLYGLDAFAFAFSFVGIFGLVISIPAFLFQVIYLICNRKNNISVKIIVALLLLISTLIMFFICHRHFLSIDLDQFRI